MRTLDKPVNPASARTACMARLRGSASRSPVWGSRPSSPSCDARAQDAAGRRRPNRSGRRNGCRRRRSRLARAALLLGRPESRGHVHEPRYERHPDGPAGAIRHARTSDGRGIQRTRRGRSGRSGRVGRRPEQRRPLQLSALDSAETGTRTFGYTSYIIDPKDGQMPALTTEGREASGGTPQRPVERPVPHDGGLLVLRSLHHARRHGLHPALALRRRDAHRSIADRSRDQLRDAARHANHPARRPPAGGSGRASVHGLVGRTLGRRHARRRDDQLDRQARRRTHAAQRGPQADRALHAHRSGHDRLRRDRRRSAHVRAALDVPAHADDAARLRGARVFVPRRQFLRRQRAQGREGVPESASPRRRPKASPFPHVLPLVPAAVGASESSSRPQPTKRRKSASRSRAPRPARLPPADREREPTECGRSASRLSGRPRASCSRRNPW